MIENIRSEQQAKKLLQDREKRFYHQQELLHNYGHSLLVIKANYPGSCKQNPHSTTAVTLIWSAVKQLLSKVLLFAEITSTMEGMVVFAIVDKDGSWLKQAMVQLEEEHPLGRFVDIDVFEQNRSFQRSDYGLPPRTCYLCGEIAHSCVRSQKHEANDIQSYFHKAVEHHCASNIEHAILFALLAEVSCYPKFGLVTPFSNGSHHDMDFSLFVRSSLTIATLLAKVMDIDVLDTSDYKAIFLSLREFGKTIETAMMKETNGVNTHKGAIFLFLLLLTGYRLGGTVNQIPDQVTKLSAALADDFRSLCNKDREMLTHGEKLYCDYGLAGVRGLAMNGMTSVIHKYLPYFSQMTGEMNERLVSTLLLIMEECEDTTIVHRGGMEALGWLQSNAKQVRLEPALRESFEKECIQRKLSPGGSADILALVVLLSILQQK